MVFANQENSWSTTWQTYDKEAGVTNAGLFSKSSFRLVLCGAQAADARANHYDTYDSQKPNNSCA